MKLFGINEFAARFPNALCGVVSLLVLYNTGRRLISSGFGIRWTLFYAGSLLPFFYFKSGIIDPWFNLFIFLGIFQLYLYLGNPVRPMLNIAGSSFFIGLAVLTKGPVALLVFLLTAGIFLIIKKFSIRIRLRDVLIYLLILMFTGGFWFILQIMKGNFPVIADFIVYQIRLFRTEDAGHGGFLLYHFVVLFAGWYPASYLHWAWAGSREGRIEGLLTMMLVLFWWFNSFHHCQTKIGIIRRFGFPPTFMAA
jgi:4-amino-4-deoxy-L-arabinose transferase-like glycosyltransferase